jgi:hypothetical protein
VKPFELARRPGLDDIGRAKQKETDNRERRTGALRPGSDSAKFAGLARIDMRTGEIKPIHEGRAAGYGAVLAPAFLLSTGKLDVSGGGKDALCALAKASGSGMLRVSAVAADDDVPAALKAKVPNGWAYAGAAAASVADTLETKCGVARTRISLGSPSTATAFASQSPPSPRVEILLETSKKP